MKSQALHGWYSWRESLEAVMIEQLDRRRVAERR